MTYKMYSIKDTKVGFMSPFFMQNDAVAKRALATTVNASESNMIRDNVADMELWSIGEFDDSLGVFTPNTTFICTALEVKTDA